jgi:hypothetical protein
MDFFAIRGKLLFLSGSGLSWLLRREKVWKNETDHSGMNEGLYQRYPVWIW